MTARTTGVPGRAVLLPVAALLALALGGCTAGTGPAPPGRTPGPPPTARSAVSRTGGDAVAVVAGASPGELSAAVSRRLFDSSPAVVVASADDAEAVRGATAQAGHSGLPLLIADMPVAGPGLAAEVARLRARAVLAFGTVGRRLTGLPVPVLTSPEQLPDLTHPPAQSLDLLVPAGATDPGTAAGAASTLAAGGRVVPVVGGDLRADPAAIAALAQHPDRVLALGSDLGPVEVLRQRVALAATGRQLPGGGQLLFPGRRLVALYGTPGTPSLGVLGEQDVAVAVQRAQRVAAPYVPLSDVPVVPTFELIATVASGAAGRNGDFSNAREVSDLRPWVLAAGQAGMYVVLDLQPGRADFLSQAKRYTELLQLPYVGLALDAEWRLRPDQRPLQQIGSVGVDEVNAVVDWLADLTTQAVLPQKLLVLHQFRTSMIRDVARLDTSRDEVSVLVHMDGQGAPSTKDETWASVTRGAPPGVTFGWKNFYDEDHPTLTPGQTMAHRPTPVMISYQ